jgi:hypothetical protein
MIKPSMQEWRRVNAPPTRSRWVLLAQILWSILIFLTVGRAALYHLSSAHRGSYIVFADGGRHWLHGEPVYDSVNPNSLIVFRYSPLTAVSCVPYAFVSEPVGSALLRALSVAVFGLGFWSWTRTVLPRPDQRDLRAMAWLLCLGMICVSMMEVQLNLLTIGFILMALAAAHAQRWNLAAVAISLACCLKIYAIALPLVLVVAYPRRFAGRWLMAMLACFALPFLFQRPEYVWSQYCDWIQWGLNSRLPQGLGFQDFKLICKLYLLPLDNRTYQILEVFSGAAIAGICLLRRLQGRSVREFIPIAGALCVAWMMAFGPATEPLTYVQLAPLVAVAAVLAWSSPSRIWYRAIVTLAAVVLMLCQFQLVLPLHKPLQYIAAQPIAAILFMIASALYAPARTGGLTVSRVRISKQAKVAIEPPVFEPENMAQPVASAR